MREVIAQDGRHFRLHPTQADTLQVQDKPGARWREYCWYESEAVARAKLAQLGRVREEQPTKRRQTVSDVDWNLAPAWAQWWTQDRHGTCWFEVEPEYGFGSWHTPDKSPTSRYATISHDGGPVVAIMRRDAGAAQPAPQGEGGQP